MSEKNGKLYDLAKFRLKSILSNNSSNKTVCVLGTFSNQSTANSDDTDQRSNDNQAIIIFEKTAFTQQNLNTDGDETDENRHYFSSLTNLKQEFVNDIYGNFLCYPKPDINGVKATIICPATAKHIEKYSGQEIFLVDETPELYLDITEPRLELEKEIFNLTWVYNILDHKEEAERIVFEDCCKENGFILLPDLKWDGKTIETLHIIAIVHRLNLKSIRSLTDDHLPLLKNIRDKGTAAIKEKYNIERSQLRVYFHYQPSFYHLHVHFTYLKYDAPGIFCERSHLLDTVINNISLMPDYYQKSTLPFVIKKNDTYFNKYFPSKPIAALDDNEPETKRKKIV